jgi:hypothetical protein
MIDFSRLEGALTTTRGWVELACSSPASPSRRSCTSASGAGIPRTRRRTVGRLAIGMFPILLLVMVLVARALFGRSGPLFFLDLAVPLVDRARRDQRASSTRCGGCSPAPRGSQAPST